MSDSTPVPTSAPTDEPTLPECHDIQQAFQGLMAPEARVIHGALRYLTALSQAEANNGISRMGLGIGHARLGQLDVALVHFKDAVRVSPKLAPAWVNLGNLLRQQRELKEARQAYERAVALQAGYAEAHYNLSIVLDELGQQKDARVSLERALMFKPDYAEAHNNMGHLMVKEGRVEDALAHFRQALVWAPGLQAARFNLILALYRLGRVAEANAEVKVVLSAEPHNTQVLRVQAAGLMQMGRLDEAGEVNSQLLNLEPGAADLQLNQAELLITKQEFAEAHQIYQNLLQKGLIPPAVGIGALANLMRVQARYADALELYRQALLMDNRLPVLVLGHARTLIDSGDLLLGLASLDRAVELLPRALDVQAQRIWASRLQPGVNLRQVQEAVQHWRQHAPEAVTPAGDASPAETSATEVGGSSALRVGFLVGPEPREELLGSWDALLADPADDVRYFFYLTASGHERLTVSHADAATWRPVSGLGDADVVQQVKQDAIDVLIDTTGCAWGSRAPVLWAKPAPIQAAWLTDGVPQPDVVMLLGDGMAVQRPEPDTQPWREKTLQPFFHWKAPEPSSTQTPEGECGRSAPPGVVFGVLAPLAQINAQVLDVWADVLRQVPDSSLRVSVRLALSDTATQQRLRRLMILRDVDPSRIQFVEGMEPSDQFKALADMDAVLDTFPVSLSPAMVLHCLWRGVPVIGMEGAEPWGRQSGWCLRQAGMAAWVAHSPSEYVALATGVKQRDAAQRVSLAEEVKAALGKSGVTSAAAFVQGFKALCKTPAANWP